MFLIALPVGLRAAEVTTLVFRATVQDVVLMSQYSGTVIPVHHDPRFVVSLKIVEAEQSVGDKKKGEVLAVAIHSPIRLFDAENPQGQEFRFTIERHFEAGRTSYRNLSAEKPEANKRPEGTEAKTPHSNPSQGASVPHP